MYIDTDPLLEQLIPCDRIQNETRVNLLWQGLLFVGLLTSRLTCLCGLPSDCVNIGIKDIEYLFVYGYVAGVIININSDRGAVLRRWWFWLIYIGSGVIFSTIGEIKAMQWSITQNVIWTPYIIITITGGGVVILSLFFQIALYYRNIQYCGLISLIYTSRTIQVLSATDLHLHHYWLAWNIMLLCSITNSLYNDILLAIFTGIFVQGVSEYGAAPIVNLCD